MDSKEISLFKEIYNKYKYDKREYPYYELFYYIDYINEDYIDNILQNKNNNNY